MSQDPGTEDRTILLIGSGPIQIGQAAEFDYSGAQACRALREEGARVVLVNSNPATIMTDPEMADEVYIEPITVEAISEVIATENPDGVIAGLGGQTGLNVTAELAEEGVLEEHDVEIMGTPLDTIYATEDRDLFRQRMEELGQPVPASTTILLDEGESVTELDEESLRERVENAVDAVGGLPVIARTTYTLGGSGSGVVDDMEKLIARVRKGLRLSRNSEVLVTESISGWVELEYEVMRDADDSCVIICNMENLDPMGIHTGESTVVTPSQVIPDEGVTTVDSPVWMPIGSMFSILQMMIQESSASRITSYSSSTQPEMDSVMRTSLLRERRRPLRTRSTSFSKSSTTPEPEPPSV